MKSLILLFVALIAYSYGAFCQTLYVPSGTSGVGSSSTTNVGIGISSPAEKLVINGDLLEEISRGHMILVLKIQVLQDFIPIDLITFYRYNWIKKSCV